MNHPNILMYLKNLSEQKTVPAIDNIEYCTSILLELILELDEQLAKKVSFAPGAVKTFIDTTRNRGYSPDLLACATLWENTSPALYKQIQLEGILTLPTPRHI